MLGGTSEMYIKRLEIKLGLTLKDTGGIQVSICKRLKKNCAILLVLCLVIVLNLFLLAKKRKRSCICISMVIASKMKILKYFATVFSRGKGNLN